MMKDRVPWIFFMEMIQLHIGLYAKKPLCP